MEGCWWSDDLESREPYMSINRSIELPPHLRYTKPFDGQNVPCDEDVLLGHSTG